MVVVWAVAGSCCLGHLELLLFQRAKPHRAKLMERVNGTSTMSTAHGAINGNQPVVDFPNL